MHRPVFAVFLPSIRTRSSSYRPGVSAVGLHRRRAPGSPQSYEYRFRLKAPGETVCEAVYARPWDAAATTVEIRRYKIRLPPRLKECKSYSFAEPERGNKGGLREFRTWPNWRIAFCLPSACRAICVCATRRRHSIWPKTPCASLRYLRAR